MPNLYQSRNKKIEVKYNYETVLIIQLIETTNNYN